MTGEQHFELSRQYRKEAAKHLNNFLKGECKDFNEWEMYKIADKKADKHFGIWKATATRASKKYL